MVVSGSCKGKETYMTHICLGLNMLVFELVGNDMIILSFQLQILLSVDELVEYRYLVLYVSHWKADLCRYLKCCLI